ncbi:glycosyltransferase family 9 protein [Leucobacter sp. CSA1]|uniref:Glycosyltransferase family 9 protein n=1 Tax=Leucobacter chromiisoli TaxID=2796471 RepID=A0A934Q7J3_9MICO|nr:glycosyltransferase family 9 protein [Leucobacter chromiisoli]MBK0419730.1 glycosyltransferase family 9 protein [Leucobacter chromiisoli]
MLTDPEAARPAAAFATPHRPFDGVRSIAVLRGGGLGDLMFAVPALEALHATYPGAEIVLLGSPLHAEVLPGRCAAVHRVEVLPVAAGVRDGEPDPSAVDAFFSRLAGSVDLAVQVHGGGRNSNPFLKRLGARHTVGTRTEDAEPLERALHYVYYQHEVIRALEVATLAGAAPVSLEPRIVPTREDLRAGEAATAALTGPVLAVHPGATDPRRRWAPERFAEIAAKHASAGGGVVVIGGEAEAETAARIAGLARDAAGAEAGSVALRAGDLSISELVGILATADVFAGNDSGPRHLAQAVGTATASVYWFGNLINAGPLERGRHRVQLAWTTHCPVCGRDATQVGWTAEHCGHDVSFVDDVPAASVWEDVASLTARTPLPHGR